MNKFPLKKELLPEYWLSVWEEEPRYYQWEAYLSDISACLLLSKNQDNSAAENLSDEQIDKELLFWRDQILDFGDWLVSMGNNLPLFLLVPDNYDKWSKHAGDQEWLRAQFSIQACRDEDEAKKRLGLLLGEGFNEMPEIKTKSDQALAEGIAALLQNEKSKFDDQRRQLLAQLQQALISHDARIPLKNWQEALLRDYEELKKVEHEQD